ncbi:inner membrane protein YqjA [bacterium BMS3Bbin14]|nr:inner membrane protein YqjA [bacterium BMS3Abin13]GBE52050.1 inner membrane protein YqjA [bacterium BMS3Bbin14]HDO29924.1 DedA family protein [Desulfobacteraceae bacterium]
MFHVIVNWLVNTVDQWGYIGIVVLMFLESSFFPFPSEVVVPPAGYLAARGEMSLGLVIAAAIAGSLLGALFNYWLAVQWGRPLFEKYGRYFLVSRKSLDRSDRFFARHGHISTFIGRLLPGIRQYISLPAGLARMNLGLFIIFTAAGAGIWVVILALCGYFIGSNPELIAASLHRIMIGVVLACLLLLLIYVLVRRKQASARRL